MDEKKVTSVFLLIFAGVFVYSAFFAPVQRVSQDFSNDYYFSDDSVGATGAVVQLPIKRVFVTSIAYGGNLGGLPGADTKCRRAAMNASLGSYGSWVAWLSIQSNNVSYHAKNRISNARYRLLNNQFVAQSKADLLDGSIKHSINITEFGQMVSVGPFGIWTGTKSTGDASGHDCSGWTQNSINPIFFNSTVGILPEVNQQWTDYAVKGCDTPLRLYCFEK